MSHHNRPFCGSSSFIHHRIIRAFRSIALGSLGALALGSMIQPAQATLELNHYKLNWAGYNGYSMTGTLSVDSAAPSTTLSAADIWDMSVSFYGPGNQLLNTFVQVEDGQKMYEDLSFDFYPDELWINRWTVNIGQHTSNTLNEFYLHNPEGLALYSVDANSYVSFGGTLALSLDEPPVPPNTAPTLNLPNPPIIVEANFPGGAYDVTFQATATDAEDEVAPSVSTSPASGSNFGFGDTTVNASTTDSGGLTAEGSFVVHVQDTIGPVIALNRNHCSEVLTVALGTQFNDPGVWAYDTVDQYVGVNSEGTVDTNTLGTYTLTYTAMDSRGNAATPMTRTVSVVDPMPSIPQHRYSGGNFEGQGDFNVTSKGKVTAVLNVAGQSYRALFVMKERNMVVPFRGPNGAVLNAQVYASVNGAADSVLMVATPTAVLELRPAKFSAAAPAPANVMGTYTAVLRANGGLGVFGAAPATTHPMGSGFATFTVARDGCVRTSGRTAEGTVITNSSYLVRPACKSSSGPVVFSLPEEAPVTYSDASEFHLYTGLYKANARGSFGAVFTLDRNASYGSIQGEFRWVAPEGALAMYPQGIDTFGSGLGGRFENAVPTGRISLEFSFENMTPFVALGTVVAHPAFYDMSTVQEESRVLGLRCRYNPATGVLSGVRYRGSAARNFQAIWLQEQGIIEGFTLSGDARSHGLVQLGYAD